MYTDRHGSTRITAKNKKKEKIPLGFFARSISHIRVYLCSSVVSFLVSVVKAVAKLDVNLPRIAPVETAKCQAIVQFDAVVGYVERGHGNGVFFKKTFPERNINLCVPR